MDEELDVAELFHENTKIAPHQLGVSLSQLPAPLSPGHIEARFRLPEAVPAQSAGIEQVIYARKTLRDFNRGVPLPMAALSRLLAFSCGCTMPVYPAGSFDFEYHHAQPSAGAKYPIEVYALVLNVEGLPPGVYRYAANDHSLELLRPGQFQRDLEAWMFHQPYMVDGGVLFVLAGFVERIRPFYGERGYRYMMLEAGHIAQNLCLLGTAHQLGVIVGGGFIDTAINRLLGLNDVTQIALYIIAVGVPKS
jgi:SagB-type dehydrogenase family enzyme